MSRARATVDHETLAELARRFSGAPWLGLMLMGSRAQGTAGPYSDVDVVCCATGDDRLIGPTLPDYVALMIHATVARIQQFLAEATCASSA